MKVERKEGNKLVIVNQFVAGNLYMPISNPGIICLMTEGQELISVYTGSVWSSVGITTFKWVDVTGQFVLDVTGQFVLKEI